jgi:hypothetical protein
MNVWGSDGYPYAIDFEWSPFPGEEGVVYGARKSDRMVIRRDLDTGVETAIVSYDPDNGNDPQPLVRRWTTDNHLIVMLDGADDVDPWVNGVYEIDVQAGTRTLFAPPSVNDYWELSHEDRKRWPIVVSHGHGGLSPDRTLFFRGGQLFSWDGEWGEEVLVEFPQSLVYTGFDHVSWKSSNKWWVTEDWGQNFWGESPSPFVDTFGQWQCFVDGTCRNLQDVQEPSSWQGCYNWPVGPFPTLRKDGRQMVYIANDGQYSRCDNDVAGATPWAPYKLFLVDFEPSP